MGLNVFGDAPKGLTAFSEESIGGGDRFRMAEHVGKVIIVTVHGPKEVPTSNGVKTAIACDVVVVPSGEKFEDALIFNAAPVDQLRSKAGQAIVAKIGSYQTKQGGQAPKFEAPSPADVTAAEKTLAA